MPSDQFDFYKKTNYYADHSTGRIKIRIGRINSDLDQILIQNRQATWTFITAFNPASKLLEIEDNEARHEKLIREIQQRDYAFTHGEGIGDDEAWPPEKSILIFGMTKPVALQLGRDYGQNAVVWGQLHHAAELIDCR